MEELKFSPSNEIIARPILREIQARLKFLIDFSEYHFDCLLRFLFHRLEISFRFYFPKLGWLPRLRSCLSVHHRFINYHDQS